MGAIASLHIATPPRETGVEPSMSALRRAHWFREWPVPALASLSSSSVIRSYGTGEPVTPDDARGRVILVIKGKLKVARRGQGEREVTLETFCEGELAVPPAAEPGVAPPEWRAAETSLLLLVPREDFIAQATAYPPAMVALARDFERRLASAQALASDLVLASVERRLHDALGAIARDDGDAGAGGEIVVARCPTQQEIGRRIGACRETVSRLVAAFARQGLLTLHGRRLVLLPSFFAGADALPRLRGN